MHRVVLTVGFFAAYFASTPRPVSAAPITIPTVHVGNPGNAPEPLSADLHRGSVAKSYRIGTTEVTNAQYAAFLNAKAVSDPLGLYDTNMASDVQSGGITRSGVSGSYSYSTKPNMDDKPVNFVTWYDSIRFANWLNNGQGASDTETGAYTLLGGTPTPSNGDSISRNPGASWFLPTVDEWYKAAYHQPAAQGGDSDDYWRYPTKSNSPPTPATANAVGDINNPGTNVANYNSAATWNGAYSNFTTVGSAGPLSNSFYGTADQGGNASEWNETLTNQTIRGYAGGSKDDEARGLTLFNVGFVDPRISASLKGFRVATVPEPGTLSLATIAGALLSIAAHRRR